MQLGMIGLGRMGANMVRRLQKAGHKCVVYDRSAEAVKQLAGEGATGSTSIDDLISKLQQPRAIWLMVPAAVVDSTIADLAPKLSRDDILLEGGNSYYIDDIRRAKELAPKGIHYVDVGTSGGVWGLERGYCQMIGGEKNIVQHLDPIFKILAPGRGDIPRTPGREKSSGTSDPLQPIRRWSLRQNGTQRNRIRFDGCLRRRHECPEARQCRPHKTRSGRRNNSSSRSRTLSIRLQPRRCRRSLAPRQRCRLVASRSHCHFAARAAHTRTLLWSSFRFRRGRWTILAAIESTTPAPVLTAALYQRFTSRGEDDFAAKLLSAMRFQFGGHVEKKSGH
jgi:6-phosphogluconate dehydrogenase